MKRLIMAVAAIFLGWNATAIAQTAILRPPGGLAIDGGTKTATANSGAAALNKMAGVITSEALTTAAGANYTLTVTNSSIAASDQVYASVAYGTSTAGSPVVSRATPAAGSFTIVVRNVDAAAAFNGTLRISFLVLKN